MLKPERDLADVVHELAPDGLVPAAERREGYEFWRRKQLEHGTIENYLERTAYMLHPAYTNKLIEELMRTIVTSRSEQVGRKAFEKLRFVLCARSGWTCQICSDAFPPKPARVNWADSRLRVYCAKDQRPVVRCIICAGKLKELTAADVRKYLARRLTSTSKA